MLLSLLANMIKIFWDTNRYQTCKITAVSSHISSLYSASLFIHCDMEYIAALRGRQVEGKKNDEEAMCIRLLNQAQIYSLAASMATQSKPECRG